MKDDEEPTVNRRKNGGSNNKNNTNALLDLQNSLSNYSDGIDNKGDIEKNHNSNRDLVDDGSYNSDDDDDYDDYEEDYNNENENDETGGLLSSSSSNKSSKKSKKSNKMSFQIRNGNTIHEIVIPSQIKLIYDTCTRSRMSMSYFMKLGWVFLVLYVLIESMTRMHHHATKSNAFMSFKPAYVQQKENHMEDNNNSNENKMTTYYGEDDPRYSKMKQDYWQEKENPLTNPNLPANTKNTDASVPISTTSSVTQPQPQSQPQSQSQPQGHMISFANLPPHIENNLSDLLYPFDPQIDVPIFWHVPRAAGTTMKTIFGTCMGMVMASEQGIRDGHDQDTELQVIELEHPMGYFVNVDTTSIPGIERAKNLGLVQSEMADVIVSYHFQEVSHLFDDDTSSSGSSNKKKKKARFFTMLRHPVDRASSQFYFLQANQGFGNEELASYTIEQYAQSKFVDSNWMVRFLTGKKSGDLNLDDLNMAKEILRKKFLIGLYEHYDESFDRFMNYFGWRLKGKDQQSCTDKLLFSEEGNRIGMNQHETFPRDHPTWNLLATVNNWDVRLFEYAQELFGVQHEGEVQH